MILNDMKGDDMIIYNTIRVVIVKIQAFTIFTFLFMITLKDEHTEKFIKVLH